jgi:hypothetical protein
MKVVKETKWKVRIECTGAGNGGSGCGSLLEAERSDLRWFAGTDYPIERPSAVCVRCPVCGQITDLKRDEYPHNPSSLQPFSTAWREGREGDGF